MYAKCIRYTNHYFTVWENKIQGKTNILPRNSPKERKQPMESGSLGQNTNQKDGGWEAHPYLKRRNPAAKAGRTGFGGKAYFRNAAFFRWLTNWGRAGLGLALLHKTVIFSTS